MDSIINTEIGRDNKQIFDTVNSLLKGRAVDLIIGGPPCQSYSKIGRPALKHKTNDERTTMYIQYGRFLKKYTPKLFVFENVPGILSASEGKYFKNLQKYYKRLGYRVEARLLNAYNYGVIQNRKRVIIIGWKKKLEFSYPDIGNIAVLAEGLMIAEGFVFGFDFLGFRFESAYIFIYSSYYSSERIELSPIGNELEQRLTKYSF